MCILIFSNSNQLISKIYLMEKLNGVSPLNCRTLRDFLLWSSVKRLVAFFVLRGYAGYSSDSLTNDIIYYKTYNYLTLLDNYFNKLLDFI